MPMLDVQTFVLQAANLYTRQVLGNEACDILHFLWVDTMTQALEGLEVNT